VPSYLLYMLDGQGVCFDARVITAQTDLLAVDRAETMRGQFDARLFERGRKVAALGVADTLFV
jgi:hypothetical protein